MLTLSQLKSWQRVGSSSDPSPQSSFPSQRSASRTQRWLAHSNLSAGQYLPSGYLGGQRVWSVTQFYAVDFSQSRIHVKKCAFNKRTINVFVSCFCRCLRTSTPSAAHLMVSLFLCSSASNARGESRELLRGTDYNSTRGWKSAVARSRWLITLVLHQTIIIIGNV